MASALTRSLIFIVDFRAFDDTFFVFFNRQYLLDPNRVNTFSFFVRSFAQFFSVRLARYCPKKIIHCVYDLRPFCLHIRDATAQRLGLQAYMHSTPPFLPKCPKIIVDNVFASHAHRRISWPSVKEYGGVGG